MVILKVVKIKLLKLVKVLLIVVLLIVVLLIAVLKVLLLGKPVVLIVLGKPVLGNLVLLMAAVALLSTQSIPHTNQTQTQP